MLESVQRLLLVGYRRLPAIARRWAIRAIAPKYTVGAMCFITRPDGKVLLVRQLYRSGWGAPGGLLKRREDAPDAVRREVREEVGIDIELIGEPAIVVDAAPQRIDVVFRGRTRSLADVADVRISSPEIIEARWFAPDALPDLQSETAAALVALARSARSPQAHPLPN